MGFAKVLLGILMILGSMSMLMMPTLGGVAICVFLSAAMVVSGIVCIIRYIEAKNKEKVAKQEGKPYLETGIGSLIFGIAAVILGILANRSETGSAIFMKIVTVGFGVWIILNGASFFKRGLDMKKVAKTGWVAALIMGVFIILSGIICIVNCFAGLTAVSTMFGMSLMMFGFALIIV